MEAISYAQTNFITIHNELEPCNVEENTITAADLEDVMENLLEELLTLSEFIQCEGCKVEDYQDIGCFCLDSPQVPTLVSKFITLKLGSDVQAHLDWLENEYGLVPESSFSLDHIGFYSYVVLVSECSVREIENRAEVDLVSL